MELNTRLSSAAPSRGRRAWWPGLSALAALFVVLLASPAAVEAQGNHGIGTAKGCQSPVKVGDPLNCSIVVRNNQDTGTGALGSADTLTVLSVVDWVCTDVAPPGCIGGAGNPNSGNIIQTVTKAFTGGSSCGVDPGDMVYKCTLPPNSTIAFGTPADHVLADGLSCCFQFCRGSALCRLDGMLDRGRDGCNGHVPVCPGVDLQPAPGVAAPRHPRAVETRTRTASSHIRRAAFF